MNTISQVSLSFATIAEEHEGIHGFFTHRLDEVAAGKITSDKYPLLYAQVTGASIEDGGITYEFEVVVGDIVYEEHEDNLTTIFNDTFLILQDVIAQFAFSTQTSNVFGVTSIDFPLNCQPFTARFSNMLTGWSMTLDIRVPLPTSLCDFPNG